MWGGILRIAVLFAAVFLTGMVVKGMDDLLDSSWDLAKGKRTVAGSYGYSLVPYLMVFLAIAAWLAPKISLSLFLASYAVGMFFDSRQKMASGLQGYQETVIIILLGSLFFGWLEMLSSLSIILLVQVLDDLQDFRKENPTGHKNWARKFGVVETILFAIILFSLSLALATEKTLLVLVATPLVKRCLEIPLKEEKQDAC
ncbi:hypothetical protein [Calderihabitans maritimus]|uniref:UbiA prenyltransferase n=1 Tax=Calderihabitans maritimus TaxID=1246530 RepID=A0A1Z5HPM7_9FIRM|nr:hypothetical protein [Calderihabitans maritimus]GAW91482.1 hypothetical protein KKC1_06440 [Calderihabitans maritimus]